jgi:hypothetical protein
VALQLYGHLRAGRARERLVPSIEERTMESRDPEDTRYQLVNRMP